ncbi:MAG: hypothetical protein ACLGGX_12090 [Bdellovibrionia bacterium]
MRNSIEFLLAILGFLISAQVAHAQEDIERRMGIEGGGSAWTYSFFSIASVETSVLDEGGASVGSYNYFGSSYRIDSDSKFGIRVPFLFSTAGFNRYGDNNAQEARISDVFLAYSLYDLGYIGPVDLSGTFKVYLPTSEFSQNQKMITRLRFDLYAEMAVGRFSTLNYVVKPDIYIQSQNAYFDPLTKTFPDGVYVTNPIRANKQAELEHYLELVADYNKYLAIKPAIGFEETWYHESKAENIKARHNTSAKLSLGFEIRPTRGLTFTLGISNKPRLTPTRNRAGVVTEEVALFRPKDNEIYLMTNAALF